MSTVTAEFVFFVNVFILNVALISSIVPARPNGLITIRTAKRCSRSILVTTYLEVEN